MKLVINSQKRLNLCSQTPTIRTLLRDAIERVRISLLFKDAFPDSNDQILVARESVIDAAEKFKPSTSVIYQRLMCDDKYLTRMASVVCI